MSSENDSPFFRILAIDDVTGYRISKIRIHITVLDDWQAILQVECNNVADTVAKCVQCDRNAQDGGCGRTALMHGKYVTKAALTHSRRHYRIIFTGCHVYSYGPWSGGDGGDQHKTRKSIRFANVNCALWAVCVSFVVVNFFYLFHCTHKKFHDFHSVRFFFALQSQKQQYGAYANLTVIFSLRKSFAQLQSLNSMRFMWQKITHNHFEPCLTTQRLSFVFVPSRLKSEEFVTSLFKTWLIWAIHCVAMTAKCR